MTTCDFLLIGCEGCGKTTLLKQLNIISELPHLSLMTADMCKNVPADENTLNTLPTNGVELETISYKKHKYVVREIGGNFLPVWSKYYESALMFMVDMANYSQLPITCVEFLNLLCHKGLVKKNFLVLLNKIDQPYAMTRSMLEQILFLDAARKEAHTKFGQSIWVEEICAAKGTGLDKVLFWMHDSKRNLAHSGASPKSSPKSSPKGPSSSQKGLQLQPTSFFPSYANNTIYEQLRANQANQYNSTYNNINTDVSSNTTATVYNNTSSPPTVISPTTSATSDVIAIAKHNDKKINPHTNSLSVLYNPNTQNNYISSPGSTSSASSNSTSSTSPSTSPPTTNSLLIPITTLANLTSNSNAIDLLPNTNLPNTNLPNTINHIPHPNSTSNTNANSNTASTTQNFASSHNNLKTTFSDTSSDATSDTNSTTSNTNSTPSNTNSTTSNTNSSTSNVNVNGNSHTIFNKVSKNGQDNPSK